MACWLLLASACSHAKVVARVAPRLPMPGCPTEALQIKEPPLAHSYPGSPDSGWLVSHDWMVTVLLRSFEWQQCGKRGEAIITDHNALVKP